MVLEDKAEEEVVLEDKAEEDKVLVDKETKEWSIKILIRNNKFALF